ncbi:hypothetical protein [Mesorhizobium wenxiniae]|uniref:Uncharacterized protein n=1 Tax=Mesorhizobium wenxiniae TaxID=2014805 RepID=A0A271KJ25_9HYPH|nr:hypothetical protein [Mesorhizobium wenxiniae]PAP95434.1 hypothetical protein CIT31_15640 [Mesorhizobium wenxiniae]
MKATHGARNVLFSSSAIVVNRTSQSAKLAFGKLLRHINRCGPDFALDLILDFSDADSAGLGEARAQHIQCSPGMSPDEYAQSPHSGGAFYAM